MKLTLTEDQKLIYAAALFEARGTATVGTRPSSGVPYRQFRMRVRADHEAYTDVFVDLFGGTTSPMTNRKVKRVWYEWRLTGKSALDALRKLEPYLQVRGAEIRPFLAGHVPVAGRAETQTALSGRIARGRAARRRAPRSSKSHAAVV